MERNYTVYIHKLPNNKIYVGYMNLGGDFVHGRTLEQMLDNGEYHKNKTLLYQDICALGWEQIKTETITGFSKDEAIEKKKSLCLQYESYLPQFGYNRYSDAGLKQPSKENSGKKYRLAKKLVSTFLHSDFSILEYVQKQLNNYPDEMIETMKNTIQNSAGYIALSMTRKKFENPNMEAKYLLSVIENPNIHITDFKKKNLQREKNESDSEKETSEWSQIMSELNG